MAAQNHVPGSGGDLTGARPGSGGAPGGRCAACAAPVAVGDRFCEACGQRLDVELTGTGTSRPADTSPCPSCGARAFSADGYCEGCGQRRPRDRDRVERDLGVAAGVSDKGRRHHRNEDAMAFGRAAAPDGTTCVAAVVSDGVSTTDRPDDASQAAVEAAGAVLLDAARHGGDLGAATRAATAAAARVVAELAVPGVPDAAPSCTYVSAVVTATAVTVGWVGDSRAYWLASDGSSTCLTVDDSWAGQMVATGALGEDEAFADRRAHTILAWLGRDAGEVVPHVVRVEPPGPGVVLVCSDGLWNYLWASDALAATVLPGALAAPLDAAERLTQIALDAGGHDNITVVVVPFPPRTAAPS